jgi:ABC-2 type transport system permease protein
MALVLFRLRLALQRGGRAQHGASGTAWFVVGWVLAIVGGLVGGTLVAAFDSQDTAGGDMIVLLILTAVFLSWILTPVLLPGVGGDAIDPSKLEQFPLSRAEQIGGLLLGGLVAPTAVATFLVASGATVASGFEVPTRIAVGMSAVLYVVLCVSVSASVRALFAAALESRRGRDVAVLISGVIVPPHRDVDVRDPLRRFGSGVRP